MEWSEVLADPSLQDLPYKIETNEYGQVVMSPASNEHGYLQAEIAAALRTRGSGRVLTEASIATRSGVKVADVAWCSIAHFSDHRGEDPFSVAPELCVEIASPSNSRVELERKSALYFAAGAHEVWVCDLRGRVTFQTSRGHSEDSDLFPGFPKQVG
jgi:Uma2 family endonuclease